MLCSDRDCESLYNADLAARPIVKFQAVLTVASVTIVVAVAVVVIVLFSVAHEVIPGSAQQTAVRAVVGVMDTSFDDDAQNSSKWTPCWPVHWIKTEVCGEEGRHQKDDEHGDQCPAEIS